jgi:two-component system, NarL family, nitrate/nitrite response regulator NarL
MAVQTMRVLIADDHTLFRRGLSLLLRTHYPEATILEAGDSDEALRSLDAGPPPDLVLCDLAMPGMTRLAGLRELVRRLPGVPVVMLSAYADRDDIVRSIEAGARGYILKSASDESLRSALALIMSGEIYLPGGVFLDEQRRWIGDGAAGSGQLAAGNPLNALTSRQRDVLSLMMDGLSNKEIARHLGLLESTVKAHVKTILDKLSANNRTQAAILAVELGWRPAGVQAPRVQEN